MRRVNSKIGTKASQAKMPVGISGNDGKESPYKIPDKTGSQTFLFVIDICSNYFIFSPSERYRKRFNCSETYEFIFLPGSNFLWSDPLRSIATPRVI